MKIPFYQKDNPSDCGCAPVCLRMALAYFGIYKNIEEVYAMTESLGENHYTLPWGMCIGAAKAGLTATFISKNPDDLLENSYEDISKITGLNSKTVQKKIKEQIVECNQQAYISLIPWKISFKHLPYFIVSDNIGVVIPTVWWGEQPHNIVLTEFRTDLGKVFYHDPNSTANCEMTINDLHENWIHKYTDNDLLIISKPGVGDVMKRVSNTFTNAAAAAAAAAEAAVAELNKREE